MFLAQKLSVVHQKLEALRKQVLNCPASFKKNRYPKTYPKMTEEEVSQFEKNNQITLPLEYRAFIAHIGNGGSSATYGIQALDPNTKNPNFQKPFPLQETWTLGEKNLQETLGFVTPIEDEYDFVEQGTLYLEDTGCAGFYCLVITGEAKGSIWWNGLGGGVEIKLESPDFLSWYEGYLDDRIKQESAWQAELLDTLQKERQHILEEPKQRNSYDRFLCSNDYYAWFATHIISKEELVSVQQKFIHCSVMQVEDSTATLRWFRQHKNWEWLQIALIEITHVWNQQELKLLVTEVGLFAEIGYAYALLGQKSEAFIWLEKTRNHPEFHKHFQAAQNVIFSYLELENFSDALEIIENWQTIDVENILQELNDQEKYQKSISFSEYLVSKQISISKQVIFQKAFAHLMVEQWESAIVDFQNYLSFPKEKTLWFDGAWFLAQYNLALCLARVKKYHESLDIALRVDQTSISADTKELIYLVIAICYEGLGQIPEAEKNYLRSYQTAYSSRASGNLADFWIRQGELIKSKSLLDEVIKGDPNYSWSYYHLAMWHVVSNETEQALQYIKKAFMLGFPKNQVTKEPLLAKIAQTEAYQQIVLQFP